MKKIAKSIRVITVAPIVAFVLINVLQFFGDNVFKNYFDYGFAIFALTVLPILAYPIQKAFKIIKGDKRKSERKLAICFSIIGYIIGVIYAFISKAGDVEKIMYLTYLLSGSSIGIFTFLFKVDASGHMCGISGPIAIIVYVFGPVFLLLEILLLLVIWSSLELKRHTCMQLVYGSIIPIISLLIAVALIG
jgi:hypothetical protein